jgi:pyridoxamine 5'-phosphate oxidase
MATGKSAFNAPIVAPADSLPGTLDQLRDELWSRIELALGAGWPAWGLPVLVTVAPDGMPRPRVLALRHVDREARRFSFHTDSRSDKVADLRRNPKASILFFDRADALQVRFDGVAAVHREDAVAQSAWRNVSQLRAYGSSVALAPGTPLAAPERFDRLPQVDGNELAFGNFSVVEVEARAIDWLWLGPGDMRRARFAWTGERWSGDWVAP